MRHIRITAILLIASVVCSCNRREGALVTLKIGDTNKNYTVGTKWSDAKERMISDLQPLWRDLTSGTSSEFQVTRKISNEVDQANSGTWITPKWRFYRNRDGRSGIEQMDGDKPLEMIAGASLEWREVEDYLRNHLLEAYRVGIQDGEQDATYNGG
jgi:hypothetical protein